MPRERARAGKGWFVPTKKTSSEARLADLELAIDRADAELLALEEQWRPPFTHAQSLEDALDQSPNADPRPRLAALALLAKLAAAREKLNTLRAERAGRHLDGYPEERLASLATEQQAAYEAQMEAQVRYRELRAMHYRLQSELTTFRERRRQLAALQEHHRQLAAAAADEAARHRRATLALRKHARALVANGRAQWHRGLAAYVSDLDIGSPDAA